MLGLDFSSKLDWGSYIISIAKTLSRKIGALIRSMKFLSPEVALYLYKSTIRPCMEYCCQVWPLVATWNSQISYKMNMQDYWSFTCCLCWTLGSLSKCSQLKSFLQVLLRSPRYSDRLHGFSVTISRFYKNVNVNSFFSPTARLWNFLPVEFFPLTYDLNGFKSRTNRHLLTVGSF